MFGIRLWTRKALRGATSGNLPAALALCLTAAGLASSSTSALAQSMDTTFSAGFARESITPDVNDPKHPIWIAGFGQKRQAKSVHDPLYASAIALSNGIKKGVNHRLPIERKAEA